jgi:glucosamine-6-phosphate deaminase
LKIIVAPNATQLGQTAASDGAAAILDAIEARGHANIIVATGASQLQMLAALTNDERIDWTRVTGFHLDEYLGLPESHGASFRRYLKQRLVDQVPLAGFHYVNGEAENPAAECERLGALIASHPIDVAFVGIGENGHLAFNDPPADFETGQPYLVVDLDEACRRQQLGEGWFETLDDVPKKAISMSVRQILMSRRIICSVPDERKATAVANSVDGPVTPDVPASVLQTHDQMTLYLDPPSASQLRSNRHSPINED